MIVAVAIFIALASFVYAIAGQAGGTAFIAVMALANFPQAQIRPTALVLNVVASGYATWRLHQYGLIDWKLFRSIVVGSIPMAVFGGMIVVEGSGYMMITGVLLAVAACLIVARLRDGQLEEQVISPSRTWSAVAGAAIGFLSGLSGIGGGVFVAPLLIFSRRATTRTAASICAPFILVNSLPALIAALAIGQHPLPDTFFFALAALAGAIAGTAISAKLRSTKTIRIVLAGVIAVASARLILLALS